MKLPEDATPERDMRVLRNKIGVRYSQYQQRDPGRFPSLDHNTNRANYEPLREAFEEEFYVVRGLERTSPTLHIPSTNTLMLLFTETAYVPGRKILNTCWSFAEGPATAVALPTPPPAPPNRPIPGLRSILTTAAALSLFALVWVIWWLTRPQPSRLIIARPATNSVVRREVIVDGHVTDAQTVWLVVRSVSNRMCWVQPGSSVQHDGYWVNVVCIGDEGNADAGYVYEIRAFVDPAIQLKRNDVLRDWPEAKLSTPAIRVVRAPVGEQD